MPYEENEESLKQLEETYKKDLIRLEYEKEKALKELEIRKKKAEIQKIKAEFNPILRRGLKVTTSKILMYLIFINCTVIEIFSMHAMLSLKDLSPLPTLIASVITESISYAIYCAKSYNGTKEEKRHELEVAKFDLDKEIQLNQLELEEELGKSSRYDEE